MNLKDAMHRCQRIVGEGRLADAEEDALLIVLKAAKKQDIDDEFINTHINPIVGYLFYSGRQQGSMNAPYATDWQYLKKGTRQIAELLRRARKSQREAIHRWFEERDSRKEKSDGIFQ